MSSCVCTCVQVHVSVSWAGDAGVCGREQAERRGGSGAALQGGGSRRPRCPCLCFPSRASWHVLILCTSKIRGAVLVGASCRDRTPRDGRLTPGSHGSGDTRDPVPAGFRLLGRLSPPGTHTVPAVLTGPLSSMQGWEWVSRGLLHTLMLREEAPPL